MPDQIGPTASHRLRHAMQLRGVGSGAELARLTDQNEVTVRSHVNGTRDVSKRAAEAYSRALNIDVAWLLYGNGSAPTARGTQQGSTGQSEEAPEEDVEGPSNISLSSSEAPDFRFLAKDVPVLGQAECGSDGAFTLNGETIDFVRRPPGQLNRKGVYCIYAAGSSMEPVYEAGDLIYVDPHRPPRAGRDVVIQLVAKCPGGEERCFLKRLVRRSGTKWRLKQFNPEKEFVLDDKEVRTVHLVLKNQELLGF
ncbi:LexA family transcriptional regulator [Dongia deserti]|uniref:LexA family transcriptional regulator n=1 Tax=Dongia deserti TaxID=2268030 RepID=UPI000E646945|nr:XRE family transcriptional regulator [Dongia deserti]